MHTLPSESDATPWKPPSGPLAKVELHSAGVSWDAVRVPAELGERTLALLGDMSGSVILDHDTLYWLVPPGAADGWRLPHVRVISTAGYLAIPPQHWTDKPGMRWRVPLAADRYLTPPQLLHDAIQAAARR